jgi:hypothetical protein
MPIKLHNRAGATTRVQISIRETVFCELTVKSPQTLDELVTELKLPRGLIRQALEWKRFRKVRGGWEIAPKRAEKIEAQTTEDAAC